MEMLATSASRRILCVETLAAIKKEQPVTNASTAHSPSAPPVTQNAEIAMIVGTSFLAVISTVIAFTPRRNAVGVRNISATNVQTRTSCVEIVAIRDGQFVPIANVFLNPMEKKQNRPENLVMDVKPQCVSLVTPRLAFVRNASKRGRMGLVLSVVR